MQAILYPSYFPSISHYVAMLQSDEFIFEMEDNFQKQTNRNRMYIYSPNGQQLLYVPVKHNLTRTKTKDIQIENAFDWQKQHYKSLEAAYRSSPFFEYFEDDFTPIFEKKHKYLKDLNENVFEIINACLDFKPQFKLTSEYFQDVAPIVDFRNLVNGKKDPNNFDPYTQVFQEKHGFINNLSVIDLLFNEGRYAVDYLKKQKLTAI